MSRPRRLADAERRRRNEAYRVQFLAERLEAMRDARGPRACADCGAEIPREEQASRKHCVSCRPRRNPAKPWRSAVSADWKRKYAEIRAARPVKHCTACGKPLPKNIHGARIKHNACHSYRKPAPPHVIKARNAANLKAAKAAIYAARGPLPCAQCGRTIPLSAHLSRRYCEDCHPPRLARKDI